MDSKKIGLFISKKRHELNLTQESLANIIYVSPKTISKWETGRGIPSVEVLDSLSKALNASITEILCGKESTDEVLLNELKNKKKKNIFNLVLGIFICLVLCFLEAILYISKIDDKYAYIIFGIFILVLLVIDIFNYFLNQK